MKHTLENAIRQGFQYQIQQIHTSMPGRIEKYDYTTQKAEVKPLLIRRYLDGQTVELQPIVNVPVIFPRSGGASLTFPVTAGDGVLLIFSERSLDRWLSQGGLCEPSLNDNRKFDLTDAIAIPGLNPFNIPSMAENNSDVRLCYGQSNIRMTPSEVHVKFGDAAFSADANSVKINFGGGCVEVNQSGKINISSSGVDVLSVLSAALGALQSAMVQTGDAGMQPLNNAGVYGSLQGQIDSIKL